MWGQWDWETLRFLGHNFIFLLQGDWKLSPLSAPGKGLTPHVQCFALRRSWVAPLRPHTRPYILNLRAFTTEY